MDYNLVQACPTPNCRLCFLSVEFRNLGIFPLKPTIVGYRSRFRELWNLRDHGVIIRCCTLGLSWLGSLRYRYMYMYCTGSAFSSSRPNVTPDEFSYHGTYSTLSWVIFSVIHQTRTGFCRADSRERDHDFHHRCVSCLLPSGMRSAVFQGFWNFCWSSP